ncbi:hypothetical protein ACFL4G_04310 [Thermodesulfobacteriota bacterium]
MMKKYRLYGGFFSLLVLAILIGQAAPPSCTVPSQLWVVDANGDDVGVLVNWGYSGYTVFYEPMGLMFLLRPTLGTVEIKNHSDSRYFESYDCTGEPHYNGMYWTTEQIIYEEVAETNYSFGEVVYDVQFHSATNSAPPYNCETREQFYACAVKLEEFTGTIPEFPAPLRIETR